jgi:Mg2+/Co2+ transporter CorB
LKSLKRIEERVRDLDRQVQCQIEGEGPNTIMRLLVQELDEIVDTKDLALWTVTPTRLHPGRVTPRGGCG